MRGRMRNIVVFGAMTGAACCGCGETWYNLTASFGGDVAGNRGSVGAVFINNTPYQAVFTLGTYDQTDPDSQPDFDQFVLSGSGFMLDADEASDVLPFRCARVFSLGGQQLLNLIEANEPDADVSDEAFIEGIAFYSTDPDDPEADPVEVGLGEPFEVLIGVDFPCNALLIFYLEVGGSDSESFSVDFELIPSDSTR